MDQNNRLMDALKNKIDLSRIIKTDVANAKSEIKNHMNSDATFIASTRDINTLVNKYVASNYDFSRNNKASSDLGLVKTKVILNDVIKENERFSYLSLLAKKRKEIEESVGISSKGIKINGLKILILRNEIQQVDGYLAFKYCPSIENVSSSSTNNTLSSPNPNFWLQRRNVEYANMTYTEIGDDVTDLKYFVCSESRLPEVLNSINTNKFYVNGDMEVSKDIKQKHQKEQVTSLTKTNNDGSRNVNWIDLNLTNTDNDFVISFYNGESYTYVGMNIKIKIIVDIIVSVEDYIQNVNPNKMNNVMLREILASKSGVYLGDAYSFCSSVRGDGDSLTKYFKDAVDNRKANAPEVTLHNKYKGLYKSFVSMGMNGVSNSNLSKFLKLMEDGKIVKKTFKYNPTSSTGIVKLLISGVDYGAFFKIIGDIQEKLSEGKMYNFNYLPYFLAELINLGDIPLYLGDDRTFTGNAKAFLTEVPIKLKKYITSQNQIERFKMKRSDKDNTRFDNNILGPSAQIITDPKMQLDNEAFGNVDKIDNFGDFVMGDYEDQVNIPNQPQPQPSIQNQPQPFMQNQPLIQDNPGNPNVQQSVPVKQTSSNKPPTFKVIKRVYKRIDDLANLGLSKSEINARLRGGNASNFDYEGLDDIQKYLLLKEVVKTSGVTNYDKVYAKAKTYHDRLYDTVIARLKMQVINASLKIIDIYKEMSAIANSTQISIQDGDKYNKLVDEYFEQLKFIKYSQFSINAINEGIDSDDDKVLMENILDDKFTIKKIDMTQAKQSVVDDQSLGGVSTGL